MKYFLLPEKFKLRGLNKPSKTYFGYTDLMHVKFVDASSIKNEHLSVDFTSELLNKDNNIACSLELKKIIEKSIPAKLHSGKKSGLQCIYNITDPGSKWADYTAIKVKWIIGSTKMHLLTFNDLTAFKNENHDCIAYLQEQVDNFVIDEEDAIVLSLNRKKHSSYANTIWRNYAEENEDYVNKIMLPYYQKPIHYKNVMDLTPEGSRFTEERFNTIKSWAKTSNDKEHYKLILNMVAGFNLSKSKDVLMTLLVRNYLYVFQRRLHKQGISASCSDVALFNFRYYTHKNALLSTHDTIDSLLEDYEVIIRQRTSNFKVSPEDMQLISKHFFIPNLQNSERFEIKIQPKQFA